MSNAATPALPDIDYANQLSRLWADWLGWISNHSGQIIVGGIIAAVIVAVLLGLKAIGVKLCDDRAKRGQWLWVVARALARTRFWFILAVAAELVSNYAQAPGVVARTIQFFFTIAVVLQAAIWARVLILGVIEHRAGASADDNALGSAMGIIRLLISFALFAIATIVILDNLGVNVTGLVAGLGIGGIAIGLAAQGIFSDLFAALSILFDKPFRRGDGIRFDQTSGSVEAIGLKTTRIRATTGEEVVVSNANLLNKELRNFNRLEHRRMVHTLGVVYQTPPEVLRAIPDMVKAIVLDQPKASFLRCNLQTFNASSLDFELQYDIHSTDYEEVLRINHAVMIDIIVQFAAQGIEFAYPTQTSFTAAPDGRIIMPYPEETRLVHEMTEHADDEDTAPAPSRSS